jgi:hypothetical protein
MAMKKIELDDRDMSDRIQMHEQEKRIDAACHFSLELKKLLGTNLTDVEAIARITQLLEREAVCKDFYE